MLEASMNMIREARERKVPTRKKTRQVNVHLQVNVGARKFPLLLPKKMAEDFGKQYASLKFVNFSAKKLTWEEKNMKNSPNKQNLIVTGDIFQLNS